MGRDLKNFVENLDFDANTKENFVLLNQIVEFSLLNGMDDFISNFWKDWSREQKEAFIRIVYNSLFSADKAEKESTFRFLEFLFYQSEEKIQHLILSIFYAAILQPTPEMEDLGIQSLEFYLSLWKSTHITESQRKDLFGKLLDFLHVDNPFLVEIGLGKYADIFEAFSEAQQKRLFKEVIEIFQEEKDLHVKQACMDFLDEFGKRFQYQNYCKPILEGIHDLKRVKEHGVLFSAIRLMNTLEACIGEDEEELFVTFFKRINKNLVFKDYRMFYLLLYRTLTNLRFTNYSKFIAPFIPHLQKNFKNRADLDELTRDSLEAVVTWLWDFNVLSEKEQSDFY